ncbi:MAG: carboxymuconolactone decarboxylase family protein [Proteobacteria bacterium]|nr:carboxymuconolactone decarboxylase family protein [Pseudomonadota bacterium]
MEKKMRLPDIKTEELSVEQSGLLEAMQSGPRKGGIGDNPLGGPFGVWVRTPVLGQAIQSLGSTIRFKTSLPSDIREIVICTVGTFYQSEFEVAVHKDIAIKAGVSVQALERLCSGLDPKFSGAQKIAHQLTTEMLKQHRISQSTFETALISLTTEKIMELVATVGYYCLVSHTLNAFEIPLNEDMVSPFT